MSEIKDRRYMEFRILGHLFAIPLLSVKEVISKPEVTLVPNMPPHFEGMINLRGQILGIYSARRKISGKPAEKVPEKTADGKSPEKSLDVVVVIENEGVKVGVIVDEVTRVLHVEDEMLREAPLKDDDPARRYIVGVVQLESELVQLINISALLELDKSTSSKRSA